MDKWSVGEIVNLVRHSSASEERVAVTVYFRERDRTANGDREMTIIVSRSIYDGVAQPIHIAFPSPLHWLSASHLRAVVDIAPRLLAQFIERFGDDPEVPEETSGA